jgi:hypothetical protein
MGTDVPGIAQPDDHLGNEGDPDRDDARSLEERGRALTGAYGALTDAYRGLRQRVAELEAKRIRLHQRIHGLKAESPQLDSDIAEIHAGHAEIRAGRAEVDKELNELEALLMQLEQEQAELAAATPAEDNALPQAGTAKDQGTPRKRGDQPSRKRNTTMIFVASAVTVLNANARYIPYAPARQAAFIACCAVLCVLTVALSRKWNAARRAKDRFHRRGTESGE